MNQKAAQMAHAEAVCNYKFKDRDILWEALQAAGSGVTQSGSRAIPDGNKRLAVLGDNHIKTIVNKQSYFDGLTRGEMSERLKPIEENANLALVGKLHQFEKCINGNPSQPGQLSPRVYQDTVEALIGAAEIDGGPPAAIIVMTALGLH